MTSPRPILAACLIALVVAACAGTPSTGAPASTATADGTSRPTSSDAVATDGTAPATPTTDATTALSCTSPASATISETEGPYYKAGAPESADLTTDAMAGTRLTLTGYVVTTDCTPLANATAEIWQADASGSYDNAGYTLRGYVLTDANGRFMIKTVVPGAYPGRTEHIHVKVTPEGGATLTTQLYFPGTTANESDGIYDPSLLLDMAQDGDALIGTYTFVLAA
jgi:protocatechuate 3,4-dioxygenase beta subunit